MQSRRSWIGPVAVAVAVGAVALYFWWPDKPTAAEPSGQSVAVDNPVRPTEPPVPGRDVPKRVPQPEPPKLADGVLLEVYAAAKAAQDPQPGEKAFRANIDAFMKYNQKFAVDQAKQEGITVAEVGELTYLGFLTQRTQQWSEIEDLVGREFLPEEREAGEALIHDMNSEFKSRMRKLVADKEPEAKRWELIERTTKGYKEAYFALTGMNSELLDDLLAGDLRRQYAASVTPPPEEIPVNENEPAPIPPRPEGDPPVEPTK